MATTQIGYRDTRRRKWLTRLVAGGLGITAVAVGVAYWLGRGHKEEPLPNPQSLPADVHQQLSGYTYTFSSGSRQVFTVHAARTIRFEQGGTTVLDDVWVEVFGREGKRHDILRTRECEYNPQSGDLYSAGQVEIELNAPPNGQAASAGADSTPVRLETSQLSFQHQGSRVVTSQPVQFSAGSISGTARGLVYATREGSLELSRDVRMEMRPAAGRVPQPPMQLSAAHLWYNKDHGEVALAGPVDITQGARHVRAEKGNVLLDKQNRVTHAELDGNVQALDTTGGRSLALEAQRLRGEFEGVSKALRQIIADGQVTAHSREGNTASSAAAQHLELDFAGLRPVPQHGFLAGNVQVGVESSPALGGASTGNRPPQIEKKTLSTAQLNFTLRPDGESLREAVTQGPGELRVSPADAKVGQRIVTAGQFRMSFNDRSRLETLLGLSPTHVIFRPPAHAPAGSTPQESFADRLEATFDPASGMLRDVVQSGNFQFRDGPRKGRAQQAHYTAASQILALTGKPQISDPQSNLTCQRLSIDLANDTAEGWDHVQGSQLDPNGGEPTHVLADKVVAERPSQVVHYGGRVRAWRGADVVETSSLDVYRLQRRMSSDAPVVTSHLQPASLVSGTPPAAGAKPETRPVTIRADRLDYFDQGGKASYRGHVRLQTEDTTLDADSLDVWFSGAGTATGPEVDRAVADGHVRVVQPGRRAQGNHAEYFAAPGKIVMTGGPPELFDTEKGYTTGQRLTFFIRDDRLFVDGGDKSPSVSKHRVAQ